MFKPCIIIPVYKHIQALKSFLHKVTDYPVIIVDDGNRDDEKEELNNISTDSVFCLSFPINRGKGFAVIEGFKAAFEKGYTHALQLDADAQHDMSAVKCFFLEAQANPQALINGYPIYDSSAATARRLGRRITNFFVALETSPNAIKDAMCGFRVYPLNELKQIVDNGLLSNRMGFDIEIIVKAYRYGIKIINLPVKVTYPKDGYSNFRLIVDNLKISLLHAYLVTTQLLGLVKKNGASRG
jgi:glycosyltransferase involved in cell wall biosynthesis